LFIAIEDRLPELSFNNVVAEQIETVGDLMRLVEGIMSQRDDDYLVTTGAQPPNL
jgi:hypothetical protein